jgi:hypothetical protein
MRADDDLVQRPKPATAPFIDYRGGPPGGFCGRVLLLAFGALAVALLLSLLNALGDTGPPADYGAWGADAALEELSVQSHEEHVCGTEPTIKLDIPEWKE